MKRKLWMKKIAKIKIALKNNKKIVILPYGKKAKELENFIKKAFHVDIAFAVDNILSSSSDSIKNIEYLKQIDTNNYLFLIATTNTSLAFSLNGELTKYVKKSQILNFYAKSLSFSNMLKINISALYEILCYWRHKKHFIYMMKNSKNMRVLDVGCGNNSVTQVKNIKSNVCYIGLDVGDYNLSDSSFKMMDVYNVVKPEFFAKKIFEFNGTIDYVISNHNLEHCDEPFEVLDAMAKSLKKGGRMYLAFPSELSVFFPSRNGCLNFFDDCSHQNLPCWNDVVNRLKANGLKILYKSKAYRGGLLGFKGMLLEKESERLNYVQDGTWAYWGFESIIWAEKTFDK